MGLALRDIRLAAGKTLDDLSDLTRVRPDYLAALEEGAFDRLPSRPFVIGFVRAYARALDLDEATAVERFKAENPERAAQLHAPVGSELEDVKPSFKIPLIAAGVVLTALVGWNIAQRVMQAEERRAVALADGPDAWQAGVPVGAIIPIGAPRPAPLDQTVPKPYVTPGLEPELEAADAAEQARVASLPPPQTAPVRAAFNPRGAVYGAEPRQSAVILQARKPASIIVRSNDGQVVYFARQLAAGEAYRAPLGGEAAIDVSDPRAFDKFLNGEHYGTLEDPVTPLSRLNDQAARSAADSAAEAARLRAEAQAQARAQAQAQTQAAAPPPATPTADARVSATAAQTVRASG